MKIFAVSAVLGMALLCIGCSKTNLPPVPSIGIANQCSDMAPWGFPFGNFDISAYGGHIYISEDTIGFICRPGLYAMGYDRSLRIPRWVLETVAHEKWMGPPQPVHHDWRPDPLVPLGDRVTVSDYDPKITGGLLAVYSMASYKNVRANEVAISRTFYLSNTAPAIRGKLSPSTWAQLEDQVIVWSRRHPRMIVISGPVYLGGMTLGWAGKQISKDHGTDKNGTIAVPTHFYKVLLDTQTFSAIGFLVPNDGGSVALSRQIVKNIPEIENDTGLIFFPGLTPEQSGVVMAPASGSDWPLE